MLHLSPPCRFFTPHWKLLDTMWGVLLHGTYSTRPLASTVKVLPLTLLLTYRPQFLIMQPAPHEQLCPAVLLSIELNFTETNFNLKAGEAWGTRSLQRGPGIPYLLSSYLRALFCPVHWGTVWPAAGSSFVSTVPELCTFASCVLISDTRLQPMGH